MGNKLCGGLILGRVCKWLTCKPSYMVKVKTADTVPGQCTFCFGMYIPPSCLHVTHGALCPSPALTLLNPRPKYVKVNPSRAVPCGERAI